MWYPNDSVGILSLKLFYRNPFPFFLLHSFYFPPSFLLSFYFLHLLFPFIFINYLPSWGCELLIEVPSCCDYQTITTLGKREVRGKKEWAPQKVNVNNHLLLLILSSTQSFQINKIFVFLFCPTSPHSATACCETNALLNIFHDNPLWDNFFLINFRSFTLQRET